MRHPASAPSTPCTPAAPTPPDPAAAEAAGQPRRDRPGAGFGTYTYCAGPLQVFISNVPAAGSLPPTGYHPPAPTPTATRTHRYSGRHPHRHRRHAAGQASGDPAPASDPVRRIRRFRLATRSAASLICSACPGSTTPEPSAPSNVNVREYVVSGTKSSRRPPGWRPVADRPADRPPPGEPPSSSDSTKAGTSPGSGCRGSTARLSGSRPGQRARPRHRP